MSGQAFIVIGPRIAANYGLQIQAFGVNLLNSLMKFMTVKGNASKNKEVYRYCSQSASHSFSFKNII